MKLKRFLSIIAAAVVAVSLVSCKSGKQGEIISDYVVKDTLPLGGVVLENVPDSLAVYKNIAFILHDGTVERIDLCDGEKVTIVEQTDAIAVGCDGSRLAAVGQSSLEVYDYDGGKLDKVDFKDTQISPSCVGIGGESVLIADRSDKNLSKLYLADLDKGELSLLPDTWSVGTNKPVITRVGVSPDGTALISFSYNPSIAGYSTGAVRYSIENDIVMSTPLDSSEASYGILNADGGYYYIKKQAYRSGESMSQIISKVSADGTSSNIMLVDNAGLEKFGIKPQEVYTFSVDGSFENYDQYLVLDSYWLEYADGESFVIYNSTAGTLATVGIDTGLESLKLIMPETMGIETKLRDVVSKYIAKTGRQIVVTTYPEEEYADRLRTKLLAGDSDFDIFIADEQSLAGILENSAYEPLDGYEGVSDNFDSVLAEGVRNMMTSDNNLFGVPMRVSFWGCLEQTGDFDVPQDWTVDGLFDFCDNIPDGKKVYGDRYMLTQTVYNYLEDMIYKDGSLDEGELAEFFGKLKKYNDAGILCDGDREPLLTYGMVYLNPLDLKINNVENITITVAPTRSGTKYLEVIDTLMMNRSSEHKEAAAEFIALLTSDDCIYDNEGPSLFLGRDITKNSCYGYLTDTQKEALSYSMTIYQNAKPSRLDCVDNLPQIIANDFIVGLFDDDFTPEQVAKKLVDEVSYTYFE